MNARYSPHYAITREELDWIAERIEVLQSLVKAICDEHLTST